LPARNEAPPERYHRGQQQQHTAAGSGSGIPRLGQVNDGSTQTKLEGQTDDYPGHKLVPFIANLPKGS
jgi:hypothetical protein